MAAPNGVQAVSTELEAFLPKEGSIGSNIKDASGKYKITVTPKGDTEANLKAKGEWDPFKERKVDNPTTDCETMIHILKASLGTGILAMPMAFRSTGLTLGIIFTILVASVCIHCAYILVKCAHILYKKTRVTTMTFADVGEVAFANGPPWSRKFSKLARVSILVCLFVSYFFSGSVYTVIIAQNFQQVIEHHTQYPLNIRIYIAAFLVPLILLSWVPDLKSLAPLSMVANVFMGVGIGITFYYLVWDLKSPMEMPQFAPINQWPQFFSITIFAMVAIGVIMPLENNMKTPQHFIGTCGVLNKGMGSVTLIYIFLGFLGYLKYGDETLGSVTLNLPTQDYAAQAVKILVALAVFFSYGLQYYVCLEIFWGGLKDRYTKNAKFYEYTYRTLLTTIAVLLAVAVPSIGPLLGLIGALCFSLLGLIIPVVIELITYWDIGFGPGNWILWKNIFITIFGVLALIFGSYLSTQDIIKEYIGDSNLDPLPPFVFEDIKAGLDNGTSIVKTVANLTAPV